MKRAFKIVSRILVILTDVVIIPLLIFFRWLSGQMLQTDSECLLLRFNGQCLSCGGTHFVNDLLSGRIIDAFMDNQFFFICVLYLLITLVLLNLWLIFNLRFAKKILKYMYSIPALISFVLVLILFLILRNVSMLEYFINRAFQIGTDMAPNVAENGLESLLNGPTCQDILVEFLKPQ